jgi:hypothetical protein
LLVAADKLPQVYSGKIPKQKREETLRVIGCAKIEVQAEDLHNRGAWGNLANWDTAPDVRKLL